MSSDVMRRLMRLVEGPVVNFPGNPKPVDKIAALRGADVHKFSPRNDPSKLDQFTLAYMEAALWSSHDNSDPETGGEPLDRNHGIEDIAPETFAEMVEDCRSFQEANAEALAEIDDEQAGHDFWLTRNRHGAGFWDRGLGPVGKHLTDMAHGYGEYDLYVGDDGAIHGQ